MFTRMGRQIGIGVVTFVMIIEALILISSYDSRKDQLNNLKISLQKDVREKTGEDFHKMHPGILNDEHIESLMGNFLTNVLLLSVVIAIFTALGTMFVFDYYVGRHILRLIRLNSMNRGTKVARWRDDQALPLNKVGELISEREELLSRIEAHSTSNGVL